MDNNGYSLLGNIFKYNGAILLLCHDAPTSGNLRNANVYIIVDPDTKKESPNPNYVQPAQADAIYNWVKEGGVLALFSNDSANAEFEHFNILSEKFGIHFNEDSRNRVQGNNFEEGSIIIRAGHSIFKTAKEVYIKELSTLSLSKPATAVLTKDENNIIAVAKVGKGWVFAVGDPWFYNEYLDGRKLPAKYENYKAASDLVKWLLSNKKK
jgi:unsaturated rhamnogalacturonyl hydrolase